MQPGDGAIARGGENCDERLRGVVERARRSEFYARHLAGHEIKGKEDLARLPLTFKTHLRDASPFGMLAVPPAHAWHYHESSGTTGEPISTWWGLLEVQLLADMLRRMVPELSADTILLNRFPLFVPASFIFEEALQSAGACHIPAGNLSWDVPFTRALGFIRRLSVTALACLPFEAMLLRELACEQGLDLRREAESLRVIFCGGAVLPPSLRCVIEKDWNVRVVEIYGSNEAMGLGLGCVQGQLHLCSDLVHIELLDPRTHAPVPRGSAGVLTVTSLVHEVMPLVRYVTDDLVRMDEGPCPCGDTRPTATVLGRLEDAIEFAGREATSYDVLDAAYDVADRIGTRIFFILVRHRGLHFLVEAPEPHRVAEREAERGLRDRLGLPVTVEYLRHGDVLDRSALLRSPKIYKPSLISDWRAQARKTITIMEALLEWPHFDLRTVLGIAKRQVRNTMRRRRLLREDRM